MKIEQIDNSRILISLCDKELQKFSVTFESLDFSESHSRSVIREIIQNASAQTGIDMSNKKILIEALKYEHGCILLLTLSKKRKTYHVKFYGNSDIFIFNSAESLLSCIKALYNIQNDKFFSSVFLYNQNYYLVIKSSSPLKSKYSHTIREFCISSKHNSLFNSFLLEHGKILISNNAVQHIGKYF